MFTEILVIGLPAFFIGVLWAWKYMTRFYYDNPDKWAEMVDQYEQSDLIKSKWKK